jgi:hypothetical protein
MNLSPVILFVYNRPEHTLKVLEALQQNINASESALYIYADGPRSDASDEQREQIKKVREVIRRKRWCNTVHIEESDFNKGLATSIITGVTEIVNKYGSVIVLEDDIVPGPLFLTFMNEALKIYEFEDRVMSISSYNYFAKQNTVKELFLFQIHDCWGWATWKRGWDLFEQDSRKLISEIEQQRRVEEFNLHGAYDYFGMLQNQLLGKVNSWAIRWYASGFVNWKLSLYPKNSLTKNIGFDGTGTYSGIFNYSDNQRQWSAALPAFDNIPLVNDASAVAGFRDYFDSLRRSEKRSYWQARLVKLFNTFRN